MTDPHPIDWLFLALLWLPVLCVAQDMPVRRQWEWATPVPPEPTVDMAVAPIRVKGVVFEDTNANGVRDTGEAGLPGVSVSDGLHVVRSGPDGGYVIDGVRRDVNRFVFVTVPTGYRLGRVFYREIPEEGGDLTADFGLVPDPASLKRDHGFAHITDTHTTGPGVELFAQTAGLPIVFTVVTGDLTNDGRHREQMDHYKDAVSKSPVPVMNLPGNHDLLAGGSGAAVDNAYEDLVGPRYYSFDYGDRHYVMIDRLAGTAHSHRWLLGDLALQPADREVLVFQHFPPFPAQMEFLGNYNIRAIFTGHTHANRICRFGDTLHVNTPPPRGMGLDKSPATFRVVRFEGDALQIESHTPGYGNQAEFAEPSAAPEAGAPAVSLGRDWPMLKGDVARTGVSADLVRPPLAVAWRHALNGTVHLSGLVVGNGTVFVPLGDSENRSRSGIYALDAATGELRWRYPTAAKVAGAPCLVDGVLYALSHDAIVHAIDVKSGEALWTYSLGNPLENWTYGSPAVLDGRVLAGTGRHFTSLDAGTGRPQWRLPDVSLGHWPSYSSPAVCDGALLLAQPGMGVALFDAATGEQTWKLERPTVGSVNPTTPAIRGGTAYVDSGGHLYALDVRTGAERWVYKTFGGTPSPVAVADGVILAVGGRKNAVVKVGAETGEEVWAYSADGLRPDGKPRFFLGPLFMATPTVAGGIVYVPTTDGQLVAISEADGRELGRNDLGRPISAAPAVSGNAVFLASYDGTVFGLVSTAGDGSL